MQAITASGLASLVHRLRGIWLHPLLLAVLVGTIIYPMGWALVGSFQTEDGDWTLSHYHRVFSPYYIGVLSTTLAYAALSTALATAVGVPLAWVVARSDMPGRAMVRAGATITFVMPPLFHALAFVVLFQPRAGLVNTWLERLAGIRPFDIYSLTGMVVVTALGLFPQLFILIEAALRGVDPTLEEAARVTGGSRFRVARQITLPAVLPAVLSSALLGMIEVMALFGPPAVIGVPAKIYVMSTQIYVELSGSPPRMEFSAALSILFLITAGVLLAMQGWLVRRRSFAVIGGKGFRQRPVPLGPWRFVALAACVALLLLALVVPAAVLVLISVSRIWTAGPSVANLTLDFYRTALSGQGDTMLSLGNTILIASTVLAATLLAGLPLSWIVARSHGWSARLIRVVTFLPFSIPAVVFTVGVILAFIRPPFVLYGTLGIIIVCYFGRFLPYAVQPLSDAIRQVDHSLTEAARVVGSGPLRTGTRIVLPLLKYSAVSTALLIFVACVREIVSIALLYSPGTETVMMLAMRLWDEGRVQVTAALVVFTLVLVTVFYGLARLVARPKGI